MRLFFDVYYIYCKKGHASLCLKHSWTLIDSGVSGRTLLFSRNHKVGDPSISGRHKMLRMAWREPTSNNRWRVFAHSRRIWQRLQL